MNERSMWELYKEISKVKEDTKKSVSTDGKWIKYKQGSDYNLLSNSLEGHYTTDWQRMNCFGEYQLENGDIYVYYTYDKNGEAKIPRITIRMNGKDEIAEIRGIADSRNLEPEMIPVLEKKLEEFPDDRYEKKVYDTRLLTQIDNKVKNGYDLSLEELKFLYEIDDEIEGFGYKKDSKIEEIRAKRNQTKDLNYIFTYVKEIEGDLFLNYLTSADSLILPKKIEGGLYLRRLTRANVLALPKEIKGDLWLESLINVESLVLPEKIGGDLNLWHLTTTEGLVLPIKIGGSLDLNSLTSAKKVIFPKKIGRNLYLNRLTSTEGLVLPEQIGGDLNLRSLTSAEDLVLPKEIGGSLDLSGLTSTEGLVLPEQIGGALNLDGLTSADNLVLPEKISGDLRLWNLTNVKDLVLPKEIGGDSYLNDLTSAKNLVLPEKMGGHLYLNGLTSADSLILPIKFPLEKLIVSSEIKAEIQSHPELYYRNNNYNENINE